MVTRYTKVGDILTVREVDNPANVGYFYLSSLFTTLINPDKKQATISYISGSITGPVPAGSSMTIYLCAKGQSVGNSHRMGFGPQNVGLGSFGGVCFGPIIATAYSLDDVPIYEPAL